MALQPGTQLRGNLEALNKLIARRDGIFLFYLLHDVRVALREDVKRELTHRLRARSRWRDACRDFEYSCIALCPSPGHKCKRAHC